MTDQGRHILKRLPKRVYDWTPPSVVYIKRHPATLRALEKLAEKKAAKFIETVTPVTAGWGEHLIAEFQSIRAPLAIRLDTWWNHCREKVRLGKISASKWQMETLYRSALDYKNTLFDMDLIRSEIYGDADCLATMVATSDGQITEKTISELSRHTRRQFEDPIDYTGAGDDDSNRQVDGSEIEVDDYAGTIDVEDFAVLLAWLMVINDHAARKGKSITEYHHLVIDEAQDCAPVELRVLGQSLSDDATLTIAGDAAQQSDPTVVFRGWDDALSQLAVNDSSEARLRTNYRCPRPVAEFAHHVLGPLAPSTLPKSIREGRDVIFSHYPNEGLAIVAITEALSQLSSNEPLASVAIICENEENASHFYESLTSTLDVRLVIDGEFSFKPGIDVTNVSQVKGLEFDYVILPDVNVGTYPDSPVARRALHIAITRAVHQLWVISVGKKSDILTGLNMLNNHGS